MSNVRGPTSALTEFLREKNIHIPNANRFRRREEAEATPAAIAEASASADAIAQEALQQQLNEAGPSTRPKRKSTEAPKPKPQAKKRKSKIGASMNFDEEDDDDDEDSETQSETERGGGGSEDDDVKPSRVDGDGDAEGDKWQQIHQGLVSDVSQKLTTFGSLDNCPGCSKRFCITGYTVQSPSGGLCHKCGPTYTKSVASGVGTARGAKAKGKTSVAANSSFNGAGASTSKTGGRKPVQRKKPTMQKPQDKKVLPTLQSMCIDIISEYIEDVEALGGIGRQSIDTLSKSISKSRRLNSQTVQLFLEPEIESLSLYDCSKLDTDSLQSIATFSPLLEHVNLQLCGQMDNAALDAWTQKLKHLRRLELYGPYLVRVDAWHRFFRDVGERLESFKVRESARFDLGCVQEMVKHCQNLSELGLAQIGPLDGDCLKALHPLTNLTYLDVSDPGVFSPGVPPKSLADDEVIELLSHVGHSLCFLNVGGNADLSDRVILEGILPHCPNLRELNIAHCENIAGDAIAILFDSLNARGCNALERISLERCRGMTDDGLRALVQQSGPKLSHLNINSCAQLRKPALKLIAGDWTGWVQLKEQERRDDDALDKDDEHDDMVSVMSSGISGCPALEHLDLGFVRSTDDDLLTTLMDGNKSLRNVKVFGCQRISDDLAGSATCQIIGLERVPLIAKNVVDMY